MIAQKKFAIVWHADRGPCFYVRWNNWAYYVNSQAGGECEIICTTEPILDGYILAHTASVIIPRYTGEHYMDLMRLAQLKKKYQFDIVLDYDDLLFDLNGTTVIPEYNPYSLDTARSHEYIAQVLPVVDRVLCSTFYLGTCFGHAFKDARGKIEILPNFAFTSLAWDAERPRRKRPFVLYPGSAAHFKEGYCGDIREPWYSSLQALAEDKTIELHAFGTERGPLPKETILHDYVPSSLWLSTLSNMAPDIIIAPLATNTFNRCKSPLKALEAALVGAAFVGSKFSCGPYNEFLKYDCCVSADDSDSYVMGIFDELRDKKARADAAEFTMAQVVNQGLIAETKPATDHFMKCAFGRFVEAHA